MSEQTRGQMLDELIRKHGWTLQEVRTLRDAPISQLRNIIDKARKSN